MNRKTALQKQAEKIRMRGVERRVLRERVISYMEYHPLSKELRQESTASRSWQIFNTQSIYSRALVGACAFLLVVGVPVAAERTVPGDVLYPVKVRFNEEVRATLTFSPYQKVVWETRRLERRVAEARLLASEGKLTEETEAEIGETVKEHTDAAQKELDSLRITDAEEAAIAQIALESALDVQSAVLDTDVEAQGTTTPPGGNVSGLAETVKAAKADVAAKGRSEQAPSFDRLSERVDGELARAQERFEALGEAASLSERQEVEAKLEEIKEEVSIARAAREGAETDETSVALLRGSLSRVQKLMTFMTNISVRNSVTLEKLLPKQEEGDIERVASLTAVLDRATRVHDAVVVELGSIEDEMLRGELTTELEALEQLVEDTARMMILGELESAELLVENITTAVTILLERSGVTDPDLEEENAPVETTDGEVQGEATTTPEVEVDTNDIR